MPKYFRIEKTEGIARLTLARPKHNVLSIEMMNELNAELENLIADNDLKCLVILGESGGIKIAIACDIVVASKKAVFGQPEIKLGFFPPYAAIRLPHLAGPAKAIEICTTGKRYSAKEARKMGLISYKTDEDKLIRTVETLVDEIKASSPLIIRLNKRAVKQQHLGMDFSKAIESVSDLFLNTLMKTEDTLEGIRSFEEKRRPEWKNK